MNSLLRDFQTLVLIAAVIGCIPYGIWILITITKKRWKKVGLQLVAPVAAFLSLWAVSSMRGMRVFPDYYANLFDADVSLQKPTFEFNSGRSGLGDGYSISIYELPEEIRNRFSPADSRLLTKFPRRPFYCLDWQYERWKETPYNPSHQDLVDFALSDLFATPANGLPEQLEVVLSALSRKGNYYSCFHYSPNGGVGNIYFYVVDLVDGRLYLINQDT